MQRQRPKLIAGIRGPTTRPIATTSTREVVDLDKITLSKLVENDATEQQHIIFDPIPPVASADPLLELRAAPSISSAADGGGG